MKVIDFAQKYDAPVVLCLGHYESLHLGHVSILQNAAGIAEKLGASVMLMTFDERDNPRFGRVILNFEERLARAEKLGAALALRIEPTAEFMGQTAEEFLGALSRSLDIRGMPCGFDFRFGKGRAGDAEYLKEFCADGNILFSVAEKVEYGGEKISSTAIKAALEAGDVKRANAMLGYRFSITGKVEQGRKEGRKMGFPTANIEWPKDKATLKPGVYLTDAEIGGRRYKGVTNYGAAPTFGFDKVIAETHFIGYDGDLYGESVTVEFCEFLREIRRFSCADELRGQLEKDKRQAEEKL